MGKGLPADEALGWHRRADSGTRNFHGTMAHGDDNKEEGNLTQATILKCASDAWSPATGRIQMARSKRECQSILQQGHFIVP